MTKPKRSIQEKELQHRLMQLCDKAYDHYLFLTKELNYDLRDAITEAEKLNRREYWK